MEWGELIAHVCHCTGWTWDYVVEHIDIPRLTHLKDYWSQFPPLAIIVAHYLGAAKPKETKSPDQQAEELMSLGFPIS